MKHRHHPLPDTYHAILLSRCELFLTVVGKDPFPSGSVGIPFCKDTWREQKMDNCSGSHVMASLGIDLDEMSSRLEAPRDLFYALAAKGIAFLNASYHFLEAKGIPKKDYAYVEGALHVNVPLIKKSQTVILCGQARVLTDYVCRKDMVEYIHPDTTNRATRRPLWDHAWRPNVLKERFRLDLTID